jgi:glucose/mannose-6-phosphate isomerase
MDRDLRDLAEAHDRYDMAGVIERMPGQIEYALADDAFPAIPTGPFERVIVAGMGGSALPVDVLLGGFVGRFSAPVTVCRTYASPAPAAGTLVIGSSFSGNTEETTACLEGLLDAGATGVVLTAGGRLAEIAAERELPLVRIPAHREGDGFQPRCATSYVVTYLARILAAAGVLEAPEPDLAALPAFLRGLNVRAEAEDVARWFGERLPVIYTDERHLASLARITKIKLNEHAKRPAFFNAMPEANHNETIGFSAAHGRFALLYLHDPASHPRVQQRFDVMRQVFTERRMEHMDLRQWTMPGDTDLEKLFAAQTFGEWCAYTCALLSGIDPTPVPLVEEFKKLL